VYRIVLVMTRMLLKLVRKMHFWRGVVVILGVYQKSSCFLWVLLSVVNW